MKVFGYVPLLAVETFCPRVWVSNQDDEQQVLGVLLLSLRPKVLVTKVLAMLDLEVMLNEPLRVIRATTTFTKNLEL